MKHFLLIILFSFSFGLAFSQNYPVQITAQLTPPFSGFIPDYTTPNNANLKLLILFTDFSKPSYRIKLKIKISGQNINIQSKGYYYDGPVTLQPGIPIEISGSDLSELLSPQHLDFSGISQSQYQNQSLPEGFYNICFTAYDYSNPTEIQVSNQSCAFGSMVQNDPPLLNIPFCGSTATVTTPQSLMFQWTAMNLSSPNSAYSTIYDFELFEVHPANQSAGSIVQTLPPIYQTQTPLSFVNYGITEPQLYVGMEYVWRVRARDQTGRDLFKNQGYSQICTFTYGSALSQIDTNSLKLTLQGTALTNRLAKYTWDSLSMFTSYRLEYRKQGGFNWFPVTTPTQKTIVNNLEPQNTYEARVKGIGGFGEGPWSNTVTITTPAKPVIVCGQGGTPPNMANFIPLKVGNTGQLWNIGQFEMLITQLDHVNTPNGIYSGYGKVEIPFLANLELTGKFSNISVNEQMEVVLGKVEITTMGIDAWMEQWKPPPGWNETTNLTYTGTINTLTTSNGSIIINGQPFANTGGNTIITDSSGNTYYVSSDGSVSTPEGPMGTPVTDSITSLSDSLPEIVFTNGSSAQFAFDSKATTNQTGGKDYDALLKSSGKYYVASKLLQTGAQDNLTATLGTAAKEIKPGSLIFKRDDGTTVPSTNSGNTYQLIVKGKLNLFSDALWAFAKKKNSADTTNYPIGKINLISVDKKRKKIVLIPINNYGASTDAANIQTQVNAIYKKIAVEWEVTKATNLSVTGYTADSLLRVTRSALNITYGSDLRNIINAYKAVNPVIDENTAYLFLVNKASNNDLGYMALNKKFGFIFLYNNSSAAHVIAHEIGHGKLVLQHTFTGETAGSTQNLMDYNSGELFNKEQFIAIHDPNTQQNFLNTLVQDEDAGAWVDGREKVSELLAIIKNAVIRNTDISLNKFDDIFLSCNIKINGIQFNSITVGGKLSFDSEGFPTWIHPKGAIIQIIEDGRPLLIINGIDGAFIKIFANPVEKLGDLKLYLENVLKTKNLLLFVNGYDPLTAERTDEVYTYDPIDYWEGIDQSFITRIGTKNIVYANGNKGINTSNHNSFSSFAYSLGTSQAALGEKIWPGKFMPLTQLYLIPAYIALSIANNPCYHKASCVHLNTTSNISGFSTRRTNGMTAATNLVQKIADGEIVFNMQADTVDIVCHSMGYAYALGMVQVLKMANIKLGSFYIIAPENAGSGPVLTSDFLGNVWQYGSNNVADSLWLQDGVAPQCKINGIDLFGNRGGRVYIPSDEPLGFIDSHSIGNYGWIFKKTLGHEGYVIKRN